MGEERFVDDENVDENMVDFANDIETLRSFVGQPYNNCDQQEAEIRLLTELMGMIVVLSKPKPLPELPNHTDDINDLNSGLDKLHVVVVNTQDKVSVNGKELYGLIEKVEKLTNDLGAALKKNKITEKTIKDAVEKEVAKVFETE